MFFALVRPFIHLFVCLDHHNYLVHVYNKIQSSWILTTTRITFVKSWSDCEDRKRTKINISYDYSIDSVGQNVFHYKKKLPEDYTLVSGRCHWGNSSSFDFLQFRIRKLRSNWWECAMRNKYAICIELLV